MKASAPATTANLGPGFDCLGAALSIGLTIELGEGDVLPKRVQRALRAGGAPDDDYTGTITSAIPQARGLGSSAACVAAGLLLGCALAESDRDPVELLRAGTPIEGHPDNLAPALLGGLVLVTPDGNPMRFDPSPAIRPLVLVPHFQLSTAQARKALATHSLSVAQAAQNVAWSSGLVAMLNGSAEPSQERLLECTNDHIHQEPRRSIMQATAYLIDDLRARGIAAAVSGAGSSVVCLVLRDDPPALDIPGGWELLDADWAPGGARLL